MSYAVQKFRYRGGWSNALLRHMPGRGPRNGTFVSREEAEAELEGFFEEISFQIANGERHPGDVYDRGEFRVAKVGAR